jgi:hypothetical protein
MHCYQLQEIASLNQQIFYRCVEQVALIPPNTEETGGGVRCPSSYVNASSGFASVSLFFSLFTKFSAGFIHLLLSRLLIRNYSPYFV